MNISDLVGIGRLGRLEPDGFYHVQFNKPYKSIINRLQDCFLVFSSHRVFYVTVVEKKTTGNRTYLKFREDGIAEECIKHPKVLLAMDPDDLTEFDEDTEISYLYGYAVHFMDEHIGTVADALINPMQAVLIIDLNDGRELLVPSVPQYICAVDRQSGIIYMQNLEELLEICTST